MSGGDVIPPTIEWRDGVVRMIDQRRLPEALVFLDARSVDDVCAAIRSLAIRGAPALGAAGAFGVALAAAAGDSLEEAAAQLLPAPPTAVNPASGGERPFGASDPPALPCPLAAA